MSFIHSWSRYRGHLRCVFSKALVHSPTAASLRLAGTYRPNDTISQNLLACTCDETAYSQVQFTSVPAHEGNVRNVSNDPKVCHDYGNCNRFFFHDFVSALGERGTLTSAAYVTTISSAHSSGCRKRTAVWSRSSKVSPVALSIPLWH